MEFITTSYTDFYTNNHSFPDQQNKYEAMVVSAWSFKVLSSQ